MPTYQERGDSVRAIIRIKGHKTVSKTFRNKTLAKQWATKTEAAMLDGDYFDPGKITLGSLVARYLEEHPDLDRWTRNRYKSLLSPQAKLAELPVAQCQDQLQAWVERRRKQVKPDTIHRECGVLASLFTHAMKRWRIKLKVNPVRDLDKPPRGKGRSRRVSDDEIQKLWQYFDQGEGRWPKLLKDYVPWMFAFACETGLRLAELTKIEWATTDLAARTVYVEHSKNGDSRYGVLTDRAVEILEELLTFRATASLGGQEKMSAQVFPVNKTSLGTEFREACKALGITDLHFHDSRHEACSRLAKVFGVMELAKIIGHRDLKSLMIYYNPTPAELASKLRGGTQPTPRHPSQTT